MVESIFIERLRTVNFRSTAQREDEVFLDAPKIVFRLCVREAEHRACIGAAEDMRNAVRVAIDRNAAGEGICLREEKSLECHDDTYRENESSNHLVNY